MNLFTKQKETHRYRNQTWFAKGKRWRINCEYGTNKYTTIPKGPLCFQPFLPDPTSSLHSMSKQIKLLIIYKY